MKQLKKYKPNAAALPPLLDPHAERSRLESIAEQLAIERYDKERLRIVKKELGY